MAENKRGKISQLPYLENIEGGESLLGAADGKGYQVTIDALKRYMGGSGGGGSVDLTNIQSHVLPSLDDYYSLGSAQRKWKSLHTNALHLGTSSLMIGTSSITLGTDVEQEVFDVVGMMKAQNKEGKSSVVMTEADMGEYAKHSDLPKDYVTDGKLTQAIANVNNNISKKQDKFTPTAPLQLGNGSLSLRLGTYVETLNLGTHIAHGATLGLEVDTDGGLRVKLGDGLGYGDNGEIINTREAGKDVDLSDYYTKGETDSKVDAVNTKATNAASNASTALSKANANEASIAALGVNNTTLTNKINEVDGVSKQNKTDIATLNNTTKDLQGSVSTLNVQMGSALSDIDKLITFYEDTDTDSIINKWQELETVLEGLTESDNLAEILSGKADKSTVYTTTEVDTKLGSYATASSVTELTTAVQMVQLDLLSKIGAKADQSYVDSNFVTNDRVSNFAEYGQFLNINNGVITINGDTIKPLTSHQTLYNLTIKNSAGSVLVDYNPSVGESGLGQTIQLTKSMVGLDNVENTALSTWKGTANITTVGTITSGTWNGTKIGQSYLDLSGYAKSSDLGSLAYKSNDTITIGTSVVSLGGGTPFLQGIELLAFQYNGSATGSYISSNGFGKISINATHGLEVSSSLKAHDIKIYTPDGYYSLIYSGSPGFGLQLTTSLTVLGRIDTSGDGIYENGTALHQKYQKKITSSNKLDYSLLNNVPSIYALTINDSSGTPQLTYTPNSAAGSITLSSAMVGLGNIHSLIKDTYLASSSFTKANIKSTLDISDWALAASKPTYSKDEITNALGYTPYNSTNPSGYYKSGDSPTFNTITLNGATLTLGTGVTLNDKNLAVAGSISEGGTLLSNKYQPIGNYVKPDDLSAAIGTALDAYGFASVAKTGNYNDLSNKPTSLPASDVSAWAKAASKPSYSWSEITSKPTFATVATSGKYSDLSNTPTLGSLASLNSVGEGQLDRNLLGMIQGKADASALANYLPLNGGGYIIGNLIVDGIFGLTGYINAIDHYLFVRNNANADWIVTDKGWQHEYRIIHSGNIGSQSVDNAAKLGGFTTSDYFKTNRTVILASELDTFVNRTSGTYSVAYVNSQNQISYADLLAVFQSPAGSASALELYADYTAKEFKFRTTIDSKWYSAWRNILTDANLGNYISDSLLFESNLLSVTSAPKLSTARTIWGKSFDGSGDVSGDLSGVGSITRSFEYAVDSDIAGNVKFKRNDSTWSIISSSGSYYLTVTASSGNVGIGTTDPRAKLDVNGSSNFIGNVQIYETDTKQRLTINNYSNVGRIYVYNETTNAYGDLSLGINDESTFIIKGHNGNVGIGTTSPEALLHVAGNTLVSSNIFVNGQIGSSNNTWRLIKSGDTLYIQAKDANGGNNGGIALCGHNATKASRITLYSDDIYLQGDVRSDGNITSGGSICLNISNTSFECIKGSNAYQSVLFSSDGSNFYTLGAACSYGATSSVTSGSSSLVTSGGVYSALSNKASIKNVDGHTFIKLSGGIESEDSWALRIGTDFFTSSIQSAVYADYYSGSVYLGTPNYRWLSVYALSYDQSSDATLKDVVGDTSLTLSQIANAPAVSFTWKYNGKKDVGTLAQYWKDVLPEIVSGEEGNMGMNYAALGVVSSIILARNIETHEQRIERLEREITNLQNELDELRKNSE